MIRLDKRLGIGLAAGAALLLVAVLAVVFIADGGSGGGLSEGPLVKAPARSDPVPPFLDKLPADCGISAATMKSLVPGGRRIDEGCWWHSDDPGVRRLRIEKDGAGDPIGLPNISPGDAVFELSPNKPRTMSGLGEGAIAYYAVRSDEGLAEISFQVSGSTLRVGYGGRDRSEGGKSHKRPVAEKVAMGGARRAAAELATKLGVPADPTPGPAGPPIKQAPKPCESVPSGTLDKVVRGAIRARGQIPLLLDAFDAVVGTCVWTATQTDLKKNQESERVVQVAIGLVPELRPGLGAAGATREYLAMHLKARGEVGLALDKARNFRALSGPGEQTFSGYVDGNGGAAHGRVVFRIRNVLVEVRYSGSERSRSSTQGTPIPADRAVNGAYTVALDVARSLSG